MKEKEKLYCHQATGSALTEKRSQNVTKREQEISLLARGTQLING